ncbi:MAG: hypothetical protein PWP24_449, partial [Clostridiales bacterium]|nr:hypothetical protein [Clostridiales bacterium]
PQTTPQTKPVEKTSTKTGEDTNIGSKTQGSDATQTYTNTEQTEPKVAPVISQSDRIANLSFDEEKGLLWPIEGEVLLPYSMDQSIYFDTLAQYKVNPALIIAGAQGMDVLCAYNGVITSIDENEETGITVTMSIGDSYEIVYGNLENVTFEEGDYVAEKTCLGTLAAPSKYYIKEGCNLFFEVLQKDETVDPLLLLR